MAKLILTNEVAGLGSAGDVIEVKNGYARNYLIPQGFALSRTITGDLQAALGVMVAVYLLMLGVTWFVYLRRGSRLAALKV